MGNQSRHPWLNGILKKRGLRRLGVCPVYDLGHADDRLRHAKYREDFVPDVSSLFQEICIFLAGTDYLWFETAGHKADRVGVTPALEVIIPFLFKSFGYFFGYIRLGLKDYAGQ